MKRISKLARTVLISALVPIGLVAIGVLGVVALLFASNKCSYDKVDELTSPDGKLSVVRAEHHCASDIAEPPIMFALQPPGADFREKDVFLRSSDYKNLSSSEMVFIKWLDNRSLLVAAPKGASLTSRQPDFNGIHVQYVSYPLNTGTTRHENLKRLIEKKLSFEPAFRLDHGVGLPGVGCNLTVNIYDGEDLDRLSLYLNAATTFPVKSYDSFKGMVLNNAYSTYGFQIIARDDTERPGKHATAAEVSGFLPKDGKSKLWAYDSSYPHAGKAPNGEPMPKWYFAYTPNDPRDLISMADALKSGMLSFRVSYWLDDKIVVYSPLRAPDQKAISEFEQCVADNHIFDVPLHGTDRASQ